MKKKLEELTFEMDGVIGSIELKVESLSDVEIALSQLRTSMDNAVHRGEERLYYREHHRTVRMLADLMYYLMKDLIPATEKAHELNLSIFEAVRG